MAKRVNMLRAPFNYYWPKVTAVTCVRETGPVLLKDEVADAAIKQGYAVPFDPAPKRATTRRKPATSRGNASDTGQPARMDRADMAAHDSAGGESPVDDAG
jgi:hypothetical protein